MVQKGICFLLCLLSITIGFISLNACRFYDMQDNTITRSDTRSEDKTAASKESETFLPILAEPSADEQEIVIESEKVEINTLDFNVAENRENELVFTISIEDFISSYNGFYWSDREYRYLSPSSEWVCFTYDSTAHSDYETYYYRFKEDEKIWSLPEISVYVPTDNNYIQEITLDFDDHGYTEPNYRLYEEICFYTLKVLFPDFEDGKITDLYNALYDKTNDPRCFVRTGEPTPKVLYYANDIGLYPFYRGGMAHICIIPITKQYLDKLAMNNTEIHSIDNEF